MRVSVDGQVIEVPDDATPDEIDQISRRQAPAPQKALTSGDLGDGGAVVANERLPVAPIPAPPSVPAPTPEEAARIVSAKTGVRLSAIPPDERLSALSPSAAPAVTQAAAPAVQAPTRIPTPSAGPSAPAPGTVPAGVGSAWDRLGLGPLPVAHTANGAIGGDGSGPDLDFWRKVSGYTAAIPAGLAAGAATLNPITALMAGKLAKDVSDSNYDNSTHDTPMHPEDAVRMSIQAAAMGYGGGLGGSLAKTAGAGVFGQILARMAGSGVASAAGGAVNDLYASPDKMSVGRSAGDFGWGSLAPLLAAAKWGGNGSILRNFLQRAAGEELPAITGADMADTPQTATDLNQFSKLSPEQQDLLRSAARNGESVLPSSLPGSNTTRTGGQTALKDILKEIGTKKPAVSESLNDTKMDLDSLPYPKSTIPPRGVVQGPAAAPEGFFNPDEYLRQKLLDLGRYDASAYKQFSAAMPPGEQPPPRVAGSMLRNMDPEGEVQPKLRPDADSVKAATTLFKPDAASMSNDLGNELPKADAARNTQIANTRGSLENQAGDLSSQLDDLRKQEQAASSLSSDVAPESSAGAGRGLGPAGVGMRIADLLRNKFPTSSLGGLRNETPLETDSKRSLRALFPDEAQQEIIQPAPGPDARTTPVDDILSRLVAAGRARQGHNGTR